MFQNKCAVKLLFLFPAGNFKLEIPRRPLLQLSSIQLSLIQSEMLRLAGFNLVLKWGYCVHLGADPEQRNKSRFLLICLDIVKLSNTLV